MPTVRRSVSTMTRIVQALTFSAALLCAMHTSYAADAVPARASIEERLDRLEKQQDPAAMWRRLGFKISGFVDLAYTQNFNNPNSDLNQLHIFDTNANAFMPHLAQLLIER